MKQTYLVVMSSGAVALPTKILGAYDDQIAAHEALNALKAPTHRGIDDRDRLVQRRRRAAQSADRPE